MFPSKALTFLFRFQTAPAMPTQGTVQTVYRAQASGVPGRGQHESAVPMSPKSSLSQPSHGQRCFAGQKLHRRQHSNVLWILYARR